MTGEAYRPRTTEAGTCRSCGAAIVWAWTGRKGRRMPLDVTEHDREDTAATVAVRRDHLGRLLARVIDGDNALAGFERRRVPHFATCPPLVAERERKASLRRAKAAAPHPADTEALHEALHEAREQAHRRAPEAEERAVVLDELAQARARRSARGARRGRP